MNAEVEMAMEECCNCYMPFYMPQSFEKNKRKNHETFYCPAGHGQHYTGATEEERLRKKLKVAQNDNEFLQTRLNNSVAERVATERRLTAAKGRITKVQKQLKKGQCPCCETYFSDLDLHLKEQHPDFDLEIKDEPTPIAPKRKRGRPKKNETSTVQSEQAAKSEPQPEATA